MNASYAQAIPSSRIAHRLRSSNPEAIEEERDNFCTFCMSKELKGIAYRNLREAWEAYNFQNPLAVAETVTGNELPTSPFDFGIEPSGWVSNVSDSDHW